LDAERDDVDELFRAGTQDVAAQHPIRFFFDENL